MELQIECSCNKKTSHILHGHFQTSDNLTSLLVCPKASITGIQS